MKRLQAYKYELKPNGEQQRNMRRFAGSCRFVFNKALAMQKALFEAGEKKLGYAGLCKALTAWRNAEETAWLAVAPVHPLQQTLKDLERAYTHFFAKRADMPRFKKKGVGDSFRYPDPKQIKLDLGNSRIFLPKLGWIRYRNSRQALGELRNVTVSQSGGKWFVSIQTEREIAKPVHPSASIIGIDVGITRFATLSDGSFIEPLNSFKKHEQRLARYQRAMSRKVKFSNNWKRAKARVQRIHTRISNARRDFLHKCSTTISQNHVMIVIEDLQVRNMSKSAAGQQRSPRQERSRQVWPQQVDSGSRLVRVSPATGVQAGLARRRCAGGSTAQYQPNLSLLRPCVGRESPDTSPVCLCGMWLRKPRRCCWRNQYPRSRNEVVRRAGHGRRFCRVREHSPDRLSSERCCHAVSSRNPPKRLRGTIRVSAVGIPFLSRITGSH